MHDLLTRLADEFRAIGAGVIEQQATVYEYCARRVDEIAKTPDDGRPVDGWGGLAPTWAFFVMGEDDFIIRLENRWFRGRSHRMITNDEFIEACQANLDTPPTARPEVEDVPVSVLRDEDYAMAASVSREQVQAFMDAMPSHVIENLTPSMVKYGLYAVLRSAGDVDAEVHVSVRTGTYEIDGICDGCGMEVAECSGRFLDCQRRAEVAGEQAKAEGDAVYCSRCGGRGYTYTGIDESPTTQCDLCDGMGTTAPKPAGCEAVATVLGSALSPHDGSWGISCEGSKPLPLGTKLYAQPQVGGVGVTDAMVATASAAFVSCANQYIHESMRIALVAIFGGEKK